MLMSDHALRACGSVGGGVSAAPRARFRDPITASRTVTYLTASALSLLLGAARLGAQVREIDPDGLYPAGTRLASPLTGISFQLPVGFRAEWDTGLGALLALSADGAFGAVWGWSEGSVDEAAGEVGARLDQQGISLEVKGEPSMTPTELRAVFDAASSEGAGVLHALIREGPLGGVVAVAGMGAAVSEASAARFVEELGRSLEWAEPGAAAWRQQMVGSVLTWGGGGSSGSAALSFCGAGQYAYRELSEANASSTAVDEHTGGWWLIADLSGRPLLVLEATDGRTFQWTVEQSGDGFLIDGDRYRLTGQC